MVLTRVDLENNASKNLRFIVKKLIEKHLFLKFDLGKKLENIGNILRFYLPEHKGQHLFGDIVLKFHTFHSTKHFALDPDCRKLTQTMGEFPTYLVNTQEYT